MRQKARLGAVVAAELLQQSGDVSLDRRLGEAQSSGDLLVGAASAETAEDLDLPCGERGDQLADLTALWNQLLALPAYGGSAHRPSPAGAAAPAALAGAGDALLDIGSRSSYGAVVGLGLAIGVVQAIVSVLWLRSFRYGPLEWLWRCLTWWQWVPVRRA